MSTAALPLLRDFGDRFSPILVKELRQGLRTRFFTSSLLLFHSFIILLLASVMLEAQVEIVNRIFWGAAGLMLLVVLPLRGFNALNAESSDGTLDMLTLTSISSFRIVQGKWTALFSQSLLVAGSLLPYMVARYYFGGVEILREIVALVVLLLGSGIGTAALLAFSSQKSVLLRLALMAGVGFGAFPLGFFTAFLVSFNEADSLMRDFFALETWEQWSLVVGIITLAVYIIWYLLALGASRIAPPSENHSTRKRVIVLIVHALLAVIGLLLCFFSKDEEYALWTLMPSLFLTLLVCMDVMTEDMPRFPTSLTGIARKPLFAVRLLYPGWASGALFSTLLGIMVLIVVGAIITQKSYWDWDDGPLPHLVCMLAAAFVPVLIRINRTHLFANWWVVQVCMLALGILLMVACEAMDNRALGVLGVFTPITALFAAETVPHGTQESVLLMGFADSLVWWVAALVRAGLHLRDYKPLEREAQLLAENKPALDA